MHLLCARVNTIIYCNHLITVPTLYLRIQEYRLIQKCQGAKRKALGNGNKFDDIRSGALARAKAR
jgi:hypothetical protein